MDTATIFFFFVYSVLACDLWRSWREYVQSVSKIFGHGKDEGDEDNIFAMPGKTAMRGALARSLSLAVASNPQQVGTAGTLNPAEGSGEGFGRLDVGAGCWADEMANEVDMEGMAGDEGSTTPTPTPAR